MAKPGPARVVRPIELWRKLVFLHSSASDGSWSGLRPPLPIWGSRVWAERRPGFARLPGTHAKPGLPAPRNDRPARAEYGWCSFRDRLPALYRGTFLPSSGLAASTVPYPAAGTAQRNWVRAGRRGRETPATWHSRLGVDRRRPSGRRLRRIAD